MRGSLSLLQYFATPSARQPRPRRRPDDGRPRRTHVRRRPLSTSANTYDSTVPTYNRQPGATITAGDTTTMSLSRPRCPRRRESSGRSGPVLGRHPGSFPFPPRVQSSTRSSCVSSSSRVSDLHGVQVSRPLLGDGRDHRIVPPPVSPTAILSCSCSTGPAGRARAMDHLNTARTFSRPDAQGSPDGARVCDAKPHRRAGNSIVRSNDAATVSGVRFSNAAKRRGKKKFFSIGRGDGRFGRCRPALRALLAAACTGVVPRDGTRAFPAAPFVSSTRRTTYADPSVLVQRGHSCRVRVEYPRSSTRPGGGPRVVDKIDLHARTASHGPRRPQHSGGLSRNSATNSQLGHQPCRPGRAMLRFTDPGSADPPARADALERGRDYVSTDRRDGSRRVLRNHRQPRARSRTGTRLARVRSSSTLKRSCNCRSAGSGRGGDPAHVKPICSTRVGSAVRGAPDTVRLGLVRPLSAGTCSCRAFPGPARRCSPFRLPPRSAVTTGRWQVQADRLARRRHRHLV